MNVEILILQRNYQSTELYSLKAKYLVFVFFVCNRIGPVEELSQFLLQLIGR